jgi:hypothetical protein
MIMFKISSLIGLNEDQQFNNLNTFYKNNPFIREISSGDDRKLSV